MVTELLAALEQRGIHLTVDQAGRLSTDAPRGAITDDIAIAVRSHRDLIVAALIGRRTGHAFGRCTTCAEESMVAIDRTTWPRCRMTPGCQGRHQPGHVHNDGDGRDNR